MDEMEIINLHKRCDKKVPQPIKASKSFKSDEPKKHQSHLNLLMIQARKNTSQKKPMEKRSLQIQVKKLKRPQSRKKHQSHLRLLTRAGKKKKGRPCKDDKESLLLGVKEEAQIFFDLWKDSKNLTIEKEVERVVFMRGPYKGQELSNVALCNTEYLKKALKRSRLDKKTKSYIKQALTKA